MFPDTITVPEAQIDFEFTSLERAKARVAARNRKYDILYEVYLYKDNTIRSIKLIKNTKYADVEIIARVRKQMREEDFFNALGKNRAFFYGVQLTRRVDY